MKIQFIPLDIVLTETGERFFVEGSQDMRVNEFVDRFLKRVKKSARTGSQIHNEYRYKNTLVVLRAHSENDIDSNKIIGHSGLRAGDVCMIRGEIKPEYHKVMYQTSFILTLAVLLFIMGVFLIDNTDWSALITAFTITVAMIGSIGWYFISKHQSNLRSIDENT